MRVLYIRIMSLKDLEYQKPNDMAVLKALKRTFKDAVYLGERRFTSYPRTVELLKKCYSSRKQHNNEPININYTYWPGDIGYGFNTPVLYLLWFLRVLNIVEGRDNLETVYNNILGKLQQIEHRKRDRLLTKKEKNLLHSNIDLLSDLYIPSKCTLTKKHIDSFIENIENNVEGIPF